ncbi:MAG: hypothetical protein ACPGGK_15760 [Pikeienuella sp.]
MRTIMLLAAGLIPLVGTAILIRLGVTSMGLIPAIVVLMVPIFLLTRQPKKIDNPNGIVIVDDQTIRATGPLGIGAIPKNQIATIHLICPESTSAQPSPYWVIQDTAQRQLSILCNATGADELEPFFIAAGVSEADLDQATISAKTGVTTLLSSPDALIPNLTNAGLIWKNA